MKGENKMRIIGSINCNLGISCLRQSRRDEHAYRMPKNRQSELSREFDDFCWQDSSFYQRQRLNFWHYFALTGDLDELKYVMDNIKDFQSNDPWRQVKNDINADFGKVDPRCSRTALRIAIDQYLLEPNQQRLDMVKYLRQAGAELNGELFTREVYIYSQENPGDYKPKITKLFNALGLSYFRGNYVELLDIDEDEFESIEVDREATAKDVLIILEGKPDQVTVTFSDKMIQLNYDKRCGNPQLKILETPNSKTELKIALQEYLGSEDVEIRDVEKRIMSYAMEWVYSK